MKSFKLKSVFSLLLCLVLIAAMALVQTGCREETAGDKSSNVVNEDRQKIKELGQGEKSFYFTVEVEKEVKKFLISTDKKTVGEALMELNLISGEEGQYGLYVKTVNGKTLDYDKDGLYWAFYENGDYAMQGVELTEIKEGSTYSFKASK